MSGRGKRTDEFAVEIKDRELSYDDVQALWHAASWHLAHEAVNASPSVVVDRMRESLAEMPLEPAELPENTLDRKILAAHRDTLTNDAVIDALDRLLDLVQADKAALTESYRRTMHDLCAAEDRIAFLEARREAIDPLAELPEARR